MHKIAARKGRPWPSTTHSPMNGENLSLFSMNCGLNRTPGRGAGDVLDPVDHRQPALVVEEAGIAGAQPAVLAERVRGSPPSSPK